MRNKKLLYLIFSSLFVFFTYSFNAYAANAVKPIKILLVPGHDDTVWGAEYGNMKEADMTLNVATKIYEILKKDKNFEVHITRDAGGYTKDFADFLNQKDSILTFEENAKKLLQTKITSGSFVIKKNAPHLAVSPDIALRLYGFNKWADENKMDAMIHIHFNDYPRGNLWTIGKYQGFVIYFPDKQFSNSAKSLKLAKNIFTQLHAKYKTSNYKPELGGLVSDQKLIAVGANNTLDAGVRSFLVEYSYIYEKKFRTIKAREQSFKDMAALTAKGIKNYFFTSP